MSDLVERLRDIAHASRLEWPADDVNAMSDAADEIERLRAELAEANDRGNGFSDGYGRMRERAVQAEAKLKWIDEVGPPKHPDDERQWIGAYLTYRARAEQAEAERDALRKDAERYRWLRDKSNDARRSDPMVVLNPLDADSQVLLYEDRLDAAIDAAMAKESSND